MKTIVLLTFLTLMLTSCDVETAYKNLPEDINAGKYITTQYYDAVKNNDINKMYKCYDMRNKDTAAINKNKIKLDSLFGQFQHADFVKGSSKKIKKGDKILEYVIQLEYKVVYSKKTAKETIQIQPVDDTLRITYLNSALTL